MHCNQVTLIVQFLVVALAWQPADSLVVFQLCREKSNGLSLCLLMSELDVTTAFHLCVLICVCMLVRFLVYRSPMYPCLPQGNSLAYWCLQLLPNEGRSWIAASLGLDSETSGSQVG